ncbi:hypothetical protein BKI52_17925 [marine bacterium AO1-C]|nr:hypothetical protein BKI52_17925 [marine bacterium AO1-C]
MKNKTIRQIHQYRPINGIVPGVKGQRAFPIAGFKNTDPFLMLDHIGPQKTTDGYKIDGVMHPHRGFTTMTFMFEGAMHHEDTLGNEVWLHSGDAQLMNAGAGLQHGGLMTTDDRTQMFHEIQLWINQPASEKLSKPFIQNLKKEDIPVIENTDVWAKVYAGELFGVQGPAQHFVPLKIAQVRLKTSQEVVISDLPEHYTTIVYVLKNSVEIDGQIIEAYHSAHLNNNGSQLTISSKDEGEFLILAGEPIGEPVVYGGPFVMNTEEEIVQAQADFQMGLFN